ncbi:1-(5-phosphoribosyl)-5-amino-4-imidazole-carboxylate (AIR) carboxylase [[Clostridium] cellulosi]|uniref:1-(5-phosphoribosyl)-5-amino-4-imidazole-carboxylate (AIR) carboxylase n=1 Tax=[Clostridium] cellulosi TaxID=29343 RepID=A0A078KLW1_9FIRM|nr:1-(5-phosphoribosyl)-5-amino-4-imidazole-carboxylate (AIR) carboxylase [[Clostridium] cellulosi]
MDVKALLEAVKNGQISVAQAEEMLKGLPYDDMGFAMVDNHRKLRTGFAEVIFCQGKTPAQAAAIAKNLARGGGNVLATRAEPEHYDAIKGVLSGAVYNEAARTVYIEQTPPEKIGTVAVCTAGTSDIPVAEEAAVTAEAFGCDVTRIFDVGVAGIHRLFDKLDTIRKANVVIAVAGMEGALASVIGGLVERPVIAVPTSIGYGANFGGLSALLTMLNSCSAGVGVVNIDNGFGAGYLAGQINRLLHDKMTERGV